MSEAPKASTTIEQSSNLHKLRDRVISRHQKGRFTYHELDRNSNAVARGLQSISVRKGDRVAVMLGNSLEYASVCEKQNMYKRVSLLTTRLLSS